MDIKENNNNPNNRSGSAPYLLIIAVLLIALTIMSIYLIRTKNQPLVTAAKETAESRPATKEGAEHHDEHNEHGEHDEHSEQTALAVNSEMAELMGIKVEPVITGAIENRITSVGRVLVPPDDQAIIGAKVDGRAVRVMAEPGQQVKAGQALVVVDSPQIAELRGQLIESQAKLKLAEQKQAFTTKNENRATLIQAKNKLDLAQANFERKQRLANLGAIANREVAEAETEYKNAKAEYDYQSTIQINREQQETASEVEQSMANVMRLKHSLTALGASIDVGAHRMSGKGLWF